MTTRQAFTSEEWELLGNAPLAASAAISVAEPGGGLREAAALVGAWRDGAALFPRSELLGAIISELDPQDREAEERSAGLQARGAQPTFDQIVDEAVDLCDQAIKLLEDKATDQEIEDYRSFVMHVVLRVAQANAEGGFLGLSGDPVSRAERAVLREIAEALGVRHEQ